MIEIATKNASLDLNNDAKITIKQKSSLFTILEKEDKQSYSYPFTLPLSSNNNRVISNILLEEKEETLQAVIRKNGVRLFKADLRITERTNTNYEVALQLNQNVDLFNRKMNSLRQELGVIHLTDTVSYCDFQIYRFALVYPLDATIVATVSGIEYIITSPLSSIFADLVTAINADSINNNATATIHFGFTYRIRITQVDANIPFFVYIDNSQTKYGLTFVKYSNLKLFGVAPYVEDFTANRNIVIQHANTVDALTDFRDKMYCFGFYSITTSADIINAQPLQGVNFYESGTYINNPENAIIPQIRLTGLIEKILNVKGWRLESNFLKNIEIEKLTILNAYTLARKDGRYKALPFLQFFVSDCLPDISFVELLDELQKLFCLSINFDHTRKILYIEIANEILLNKLAKEYECTPIYSKKSQIKQDGYVFKYNTLDYTDFENVKTANYKTKKIKNGTTEIISNFPFLPYFSQEFLPGVFVTLPALTSYFTLPQSFLDFDYTKAYEISENDDFWLKEGQIKSFNFTTYTGDRRFVETTENYSLLFDRLYEQFWKNYLDLLDKSEVEREIIFTFSELQSLDLLKRIRLEYSNYYIKELEYTLTNNEQIRILAKVILIKTI